MFYQGEGLDGLESIPEDPQASDKHAEASGWFEKASHLLKG